jgi:hypothetical protein
LVAITVTCWILAGSGGLVLSYTVSARTAIIA